MYLIKRIIAIILDTIIVSLITTPVVILVVLIYGDKILFDLNSFILLILIISPLIIYEIICEVIFQRSVGKKVMGLSIINLEGKRFGFSKIIMRNLLRMLDHGLFLGCIFILFTRKKQRIGDILAGAIVVDQKEFKSWSDLL
ncbi:RDD family protein [Paenibacillus herberti]|uniref:RDD domain-containing protein n=1 Tax=Paenibacillus herberti TaxID=1619309 RepID=A0A229NTL4_9BACL|nr:RDD family protein [Paenibacillus herberti]OXM13174.1 hypothetical protein CGZ75_23730 [Paenibacillus herberti]